MIISSASQGFHKWLNWLEGQNSWRFITILYFLRWLVIIPVAFISEWLFPTQGDPFFQGFSNLNPFSLFLFVVILNPFYETIIECLIPYWIIKKLRIPTKHPWLFVFVSAVLMAVVHPIPASTLASFITGFFLAYTYGHFSLQSSLKAISITTLFHSCINLVGYTLIILGGLRF